MSIFKKNRIAVSIVTLPGGSSNVIAGTWKDPDTVDGTGSVSNPAYTVPVQIQLEYIPTFFWSCLSVPAGLLGTVSITSVTASGFNLTSNNASDTSTYRVYAIVRQDDI